MGSERTDIVIHYEVPSAQLVQLGAQPQVTQDLKLKKGINDSPKLHQIKIFYNLFC